MIDALPGLPALAAFPNISAETILGDPEFEPFSARQRATIAGRASFSMPSEFGDRQSFPPPSMQMLFDRQVRKTERIGKE